MRMDETQRGWLIASAAILAVALAVFVPYAYFSSQGPRGGSAIGLLFGVDGFAFMIFAALLGARKRVPTWRVGRAQAWMRGHLWLGLLSLPILLFHGGFHFGGTLTRVLMWLLIIVVGSGVFGAVLQHYLPDIMTSDAPLETIYDEIAHVREQLLDEADRYVETWCGSLHLQLAGPQGASLHAGVHVDGRPECERRRVRALPRVHLHGQAVPQPRVFECGRRQPGMVAAADRTAECRLALRLRLGGVDGRAAGAAGLGRGPAAPAGR